MLIGLAGDIYSYKNNESHDDTLLALLDSFRRIVASAAVGLEVKRSFRVICLTQSTRNKKI